jgi:hypothetical protein
VLKSLRFLHDRLPLRKRRRGSNQSLM